MENQYENKGNEPTPSPVVTSDPAPAETAPAAAAAPEASGNRRQIVVSLIIAALVLLLAGYFVYSTYYANGGVAGVVNGKKIYHDELAESMMLIEQSAGLYGIDPTSPEAPAQIQERALGILVDNALLITAAKAAGYKADKEAVDETYDSIVAEVGGAEALESQMAALGLTDKKLRSNIEERVLVTKYLDGETSIQNVTVSDEEVEGFIASLKESGVTLPEDVDSLRTDVRNELINQKKGQVIDAHLATLREGASIDIRI